MVCEKFKEIRFKAESLERIEQCNAIINSYIHQGLRLTLRQLYYQLVTRNLVSNVERSYKNLSKLVSDARLAGIMDWEAIEDRVRKPSSPNEFNSLRELVDVATNAYRLPRWARQNNYVELWVEKDALAGVLLPLAREHHMTLMVNRGYSSQSAMYEAAMRFGNTCFGGAPKQPVILYIGDLDPSGEDMVRDIASRMTMFGVENIEVVKVALTIDQVNEYKLPPNPAKMSDPRSSGYVHKYGDSSWEVDALPPDVLASLITTAAASFIDVDKVQKVKAVEETHKEALRTFAATL